MKGLNFKKILMSSAKRRQFEYLTALQNFLNENV